MTAGVDTMRQAGSRSWLLRASRRLRRPPLLLHLCAFVLVVLVPALLFSALLILQFSRQQDELALARVSDSAQTISASIDRELVGLITTARVLSASPAIDASNYGSFHERTTAALAGTGADAAVVDANYRVLLNTQVSTSAVPREAEYGKEIEKAIQTRQAQISGPIYSPSLRAFVINVAVPAVRGDAVPYVLVIYKRADLLRGGLDDQSLPESWSIVIRDEAGRRINAAIAAPGAPADPRTRRFDQPSILDPIGLGAEADMIEASHVSRLSGWSTTVAVPQAVVDQPVVRSWFWLAVVGCLLFFFCFSLTIYFGRQLATPILALANQARAIGRGEPAARISTTISEIAEVSRVLAHASRERREAEEQNRFLMREMVHRAKNQYALIAAIARRAAKESATTGEFQTTLSEALNSLARSSDLLATEGWEGAALSALVESQLSAFGAGKSERIRMAGPGLRLNASAAQTIGLALHELATNAAKYGSLSVEDGSVDIDWSLGDAFTLQWRERGGPPVVPPKRSGFGSLVIQKMTSRGLGGSVDMRFEEAGVVWKLTAPAESVILDP